jgi:hypothetical protein
MRKQFFNILCLALVVFVQACSKDDDPKENEIEVNHVGEKWRISSVEYNIVDQSLTNPSQMVKTGTATNAGAFYFDGAKGSFDIEIGTFHKEDVFGFQLTNNTEVSITSINQTVTGSSLSQYVIILSGDKNTATTMSIDGTISKQSLSGQFVLTGTFELVKE